MDASNCSKNPNRIDDCLDDLLVILLPNMKLEAIQASWSLPFYFSMGSAHHQSQWLFFAVYSPEMREDTIEWLARMALVKKTSNLTCFNVILREPTTNIYCDNFQIPAPLQSQGLLLHLHPKVFWSTPYKPGIKGNVVRVTWTTLPLKLMVRRPLCRLLTRQHKSREALLAVFLFTCIFR